MERLNKKILNLFATEEKLKFNEIEKKLKERSNKVNYHLQKLVREKTVSKNDEFYSLSQEKESIIPYLSQESSPIPVVLILLKNKGKIFIIKRKKRPYKDKMGLPGGRIKNLENISDASKRIMKEKFKIKITSTKIKSISFEHLHNRSHGTNTFILFLVEAKTKDKIEYSDIKKNKKSMIKSDYSLIKDLSKNEDKKIRIKVIMSKQ